MRISCFSNNIGSFTLASLSDDARNVAQRSTFTDTRNYQYAPWSRFLTNEQYYLSAGVTDTQDYQYDSGAPRGLGVLTGAADWDAATNGLDTLKRPFKGTTTYARVPAFGKAFGAASVSATLNGQAVPLEFTQGNTNGWFYAQLLPQSGANTLTVKAFHPSGLFTNQATSIFTNNVTGHTVTNLYDAFGNVTKRVWRKSGGGLVRQQDFTWNAFNQLVKVSERDANTNGFDRTAVFDGLGRRVRVTELNVVSNTPSGSVSTIDSYFDPAVEFLEIGVNYNGRKEMKVYGPDVSCTYGGAQGIGGLEAVVDVSSGAKNVVLNDRFGNVLGYAPVWQPSAFQWSAARFHSCGPKVGYETPFLASGVSLMQTLGWQGQRRDITGLYYWNARPYDPVERRYITTDPLGHIASPSLYSYGAGDPVSFFDPEGRNVFPPPPAVKDLYSDPVVQRRALAFYAGVLGGYAGGWAVAPLFTAAGASTAVTVVGVGAVGGATGDVTAQGVEMLTGVRQEFSTTQLGLSTVLGGGISYGVNRVAASRLLTGQLGNQEVGLLGQAQAAEEIGANLRAQQIRLRTPDGNPTLDYLAADASTPSGLTGIEVKVGSARLINPQEFGYPHLAEGTAIPVGRVAQDAGLTLGQPLAATPWEVWRYQPWELLPFSPQAGGAMGAGATVLGSELLPDGRILQYDLTGKHIKPL